MVVETFKEDMEVQDDKFKQMPAQKVLVVRVGTAFALRTTAFIFNVEKIHHSTLKYTSAQALFSLSSIILNISISKFRNVYFRSNPYRGVVLNNQAIRLKTPFIYRIGPSSVLSAIITITVSPN